MIPQCPGADRFKQPRPEALKCGSCGEEVEIWTDEVQTRCPSCKKVVTRESGQNCLDWCKSAKECVGEKIYNEYLKRKKQQGGK